MSYSDTDINSFEGGWSYTPAEMRELFKHIKPRNHYNVLEFGAGNSTIKIYDIVSRYCNTIDYDTCESDSSYIVNYKNVNTIFYSIEEMNSLVLPNKKYDLVLVDGPNGVHRAKWYSKLRNHVSYDTIMIIDDYNHYIEFENELNRNFKYTVLSASDVPFVPYGEHSWRIITDLVPL